ncbi:MAG: tetratricopeptide repeat protein [Gammaproteobacteria bacterium]
MATGRNNLGGAWKDLGEYDKSIGYLEQAYNALRSSLGENHPWTKGAFYNLSAAKVTLTDSHPDGG